MVIRDYYPEQITSKEKIFYTIAKVKFGKLSLYQQTIKRPQTVLIQEEKNHQLCDLNVDTKLQVTLAA